MTGAPGERVIFFVFPRKLYSDSARPKPAKKVHKIPIIPMRKTAERIRISYFLFDPVSFCMRVSEIVARDDDIRDGMELEEYGCESEDFHG